VGSGRAAVVAVLVALSVGGCVLHSRSIVRTSSVAPRPHERPATAAIGPSLVAFEATDLETGLTCSGSYEPLDMSPTFVAVVMCDDGRTGEVAAARSDEFSAGTLTFESGWRSAVTLRRLAEADAKAPPVAARQLPTPDPLLYVR